MFSLSERDSGTKHGLEVYVLHIFSLELHLPIERQPNYARLI
jgi:hypothetical protein